MTFAEKLKELRDAAGLSEKKLADVCGLPFGTVHNYSLKSGSPGYRRPSFAAVVKIAKALGVTCEAFADCEDIAEDESPPARKGGRKTGRGKA
jgi:transcriptional regulator with XRE-family HTH domain